jgi:hypothetical protein
MAYTTINKSSDYFNNKIYTGTGSSQAITGVGHQPDLVWIKQRTGSTEHILTDAVRGVTKALNTNDNTAEDAISNALTAFGTDGFTVGGNNSTGAGSGSKYASWNWKANGSSTVTNNDGANVSYVSYNSTSQFSIIRYAGTGSATNIGHGLNGTPDCFITKSLSASDWHLWNNSFTANQRIKINSTGGVTTNTSIFPTLPDATRIYFGTGGDVNQSGVQYICYAWKNVTGYSKFGSYVGNGNADGVFIYTGFKPAFVMVKKTSSTSGWYMNDTARDPFNGQYGNDASLFANTNGAEFTSSSLNIDMLSNGFKLVTTNSEVNGDTYTYIYMAFASAPLVGSNNVPATAR